MINMTCKCGKTEMQFTNLSAKDFPKGWESECCMKKSEEKLEPTAEELAAAEKAKADEAAAEKAAKETEKAAAKAAREAEKAAAKAAREAEKASKT